MMERLTERDANGHASPYCIGTTIGTLLDHLATYEDTGLEPEEVVELNTFKGSELEKMLEKNQRLTQWVNDLQSGMYVNCVYCGHRYGPVKGTPVSMAAVLKEHIEHCPEHPMSRLKAENARLAVERDELQKAFALSCRFIADNMDCPANEVNAEFPDCKHSADEEYQDDAPHGTCEDGGWLCWQEYIRERVQSEPVCRVCGCTEENACPGGCYWVEPDLCSACAQAGEGNK